MVVELIRRARRRFLCNEILAQGASALSMAMAAVILLLLLGTQILRWHWLVIVPLLTLAAGVYRTWRAVPSMYRIAQLVDRRLGLADTLSTAVFFSGIPPARREAEPMAAPQLAEADRAARAVALHEAVPFTLPRGIYAAGILLVVASSLFALRYGLQRRLDLHAPLARMIQDALGIQYGRPDPALAKTRHQQKRPEIKDSTAMSIPDAQQAEPGPLDPAAENALDTVGVPDTNVKQTAQAKSRKSGEPGSEKMEGEDSEATENTENSQGGEAGEGQQGAGEKGSKGDRQAGNQSSGSQGDKSSLMAKFRDAMQNLLSRMKQQPSSSGSQAQAASQAGKQGQQSQSAKGGQKSGSKQSGGQQSEGEDGQPGEDSQTAQNAAGRGAGQSADEQTSKQPGSGIGKSDGSKDVKLAEQLAAMGKISEIIGKRAANVSGEVTVEVQSGSQQLSTPWSRRSATHGDSGGEISRDEVPVALQAFVQQYFEQVRKQAATKGEAAPKTRGN